MTEKEMRLYYKRKRKRLKRVQFKKRNKLTIEQNGRYINKDGSRDNIPTNNLISFLIKSSFSKKAKYHNHETPCVNIPSRFSMIENPDTSIKVLKTIFYLASNKNVRKIRIDHIKCKSFDMAASNILDIILTQLLGLRNKTKNPLELEGRYNGEIKDFFEASGLVKHLNINTRNESIKKGRIKVLNLIHGGNSSSVANQVTIFINNCLKTQKYTLNDAGYQYFHNIVGEILDNCEKHSDLSGEWYTSGYCVVNADCAECLLSIVSFGNTIYQSLNGDCVTAQTKGELQRACERLPKINPFGNEALWTLFSLQEGVSRLKDDENLDRGTGTVTFIDAFQNIGYSKGGKKPLMSITSGKVSILFNDDYRMQTKYFKGEERKVIAFNPNNDLTQLPDKKNVRKLKNHFPGTIISLKLYMDAKYFDSMMEG